VIQPWSGPELGDWVLPFRGQAFFDAELDALVGIHRNDGGHVCCCPVPSRSAAAATRSAPVQGPVPQGGGCARSTATA
jgi:hypothetical protein